MRKDYHYVLYGELAEPIEPLDQLPNNITYSSYDVASGMVVFYGWAPFTGDVRMMLRPRNPDW